MVWKSAESVAFGVKSPWVVAWFCSNSFPKTIGDRRATDRKANILRTQIVGGYNVAYNKLALKTHNVKRSQHQGTPSMTTYPEAAKQIQKFMDEESFNGVTPAESARPKAFRDCAESIYTLQDLTKLGLLAKGENGKDIATEFWYAQGDKNIDYTTGKPYANGDQKAVNQLLHIIWKSTKKVGFGIKDKWVVAWYCDVRPLSTLAEVEIASVSTSPLLNEGGARRRRLLRSSHRRLDNEVTSTSSNALDGNVNTYIVTEQGFGMKFVLNLEKAGTKIQSVKLTNAMVKPERFDSYKVLVDKTTCGVTSDSVGLGQEVTVTCGVAPDYVSGQVVTIETTKNTNL